MSSTGETCLYWGVDREEHCVKRRGGGIVRGFCKYWLRHAEPIIFFLKGGVTMNNIQKKCLIISVLGIAIIMIYLAMQS